MAAPLIWRLHLAVDPHSGPYIGPTALKVISFASQGVHSAWCELKRLSIRLVHVAPRRSSHRKNTKTKCKRTRIGFVFRVSASTWCVCVCVREYGCMMQEPW